MTRLTIKQKNGQIIVKRRLGWKEKINEREIQVFNSKLIRGLVRPILDRKKIIYTVPGDVVLQKYLKSGISKKDFFLIIAQIIEVTKKIERCGLNINNLILNSQYVFMNRMTKEIHFIYQPVHTTSLSASIYSFVCDIAYGAVFELNEDTEFINDFMKFLQEMEGYSAEKIEKYILMKHPETYKQVKREQPKSTVLQNKRWNVDAVAEDDDVPTRVLREAEEETGLLKEEEDDIETGLLKEEDDDIETGLLTDEYDDGATGLLTDNEPQTTLLCKQVVKYPYLVRLATYEQVEVNKPVFRVGKEKSYVDYFIANNNAVSRLHADIITKDKRYFVRDNNSTNRTYVNSLMIVSGVDTEIHDGDTIMFANETFEFHL